MKSLYTGKRKGISLVEMTIAVILFGLLSTIALLYYKSLFNIDLTAKKARVAALMDQAYQLSGAYDVYVAQFGVAPTAQDLSDFNATNVLILKELPADIKEMSTVGWELNTTTGLPGGAVAFQFAIDLNGTSYTAPTGLADDDLYCAIFNHEMNSSIELNVTDGMNYGSPASQYAALGKNFCYTDAGNLHHIMIIQ